MTLAVKISILFSGLYLLTGMLTGVWKYVKIMKSAERLAPVYVDIAHRNALMFSFASLVMAKLVEYSPFSSVWQIVIIAVPFFFFAMTSAGQIAEGYKDQTDNIFKAPNRVRNIFMYGLVGGEIGSVALLVGGFIYTQFFV